MARTSSVLMLLGIVALFGAAHAQVLTNPSDVTALVSIKQAIGNSDNGAFASWGIGDPCNNQWAHIVCAATVSVPVAKDSNIMSTYKLVTSLDLTGLKIAAPLPAAVASLSSLVTLGLSDNLFSGDLTSYDFSGLVQLQSLALGNNAFSGTVPKSLASLSATLTELNVANNQFIGVASELKALTKLKVLTLNNNPLASTIPSWLDGTFTALTDLSMSFCKLYGGIPDSITQIPKLQSLLLDNNKLGDGDLNGNGLTACATPTSADLIAYPGHGGETWCINPKLAALKASLVQLDLSTNDWSGNIPPQLGSLTNLQTLKIWDNQLSGSIPVELANLKNLNTLNLNNNQLSGSIPKEITTMPMLSIFWVQTNQLTGSIPPEIGNMAALTDIELQLNQLSGPIPQSLANLGPKMSKLQLQNNLLYGAIPDFSQFTNIVRLDLNGNSLGATDAIGTLNTTSPIGIPATLGNLTTLQYLDLSNHKLGGVLPAQLGQLTNLNYLDVSQNQFIGALPDSLAKLTNLQHMFLEVNQFSGPIPTWIKNMTSLQDLYLYENAFTGSLPLAIFQAPALTSVTVHTNKLQGPLPANCNGSKTLAQLDLSDNGFTGSFPACLTTLNLTFLNLENNQLTGTLPDELGNLTSIQLLGLGYNQFTGGVPASLCNVLDTLVALDISNNQLSGNISSCLIDYAVQNSDSFFFWYDGNSFSCENLDSCPQSETPSDSPFSVNSTFGKSPPPMPSTPRSPPPPPTPLTPPSPPKKSGASHSVPAVITMFVVGAAGLLASIF